MNFIQSRYICIGYLKRALLSFAVVLLVLKCGANVACGQVRPDQFFPRNYAKGEQIAEGMEVDRVSRSDSLLADAIETRELVGPVPEEDGGFIAMGAERASRPLLAAANDRDRGVRIEAFGAILSTADQQQLAKQVKHIINISIQRDIPLAGIYAVGDQNPEVRDDKGIMDALWILGGSLVGLPVVPHPYDKYVTQTPSWLIYTKRGKYILEGIASPEKYINIRGEFVADAVTGDVTDKAVAIDQKEVEISKESSVDVQANASNPLSAVERARQATTEKSLQLIKSLRQK